MAEYIEREAAVETLNALKPFLQSAAQERLMRRIIRQIGTIPAADVAPVRQWISVEDRLPDEAVRVLVRLDGNKPPIGEPRMDTDRVVDGRWVRWFDLVTHWMTLPELPKEEV